MALNIDKINLKNLLSINLKLLFQGYLFASIYICYFYLISESGQCCLFNI